jgi:hypothetical protein
MKPQLLKIIYPLILGASIFLLLIVCLSGCITEKKRNEICKTCAIQIKDSIHEVITVTPFDTALFLSQKGKDLELTGNCNVLCDSLNNLIDRYIALGLKGVTTNSNGIKSTITKNTKGNFVFKCEADSLKAVITLLKKSKSIERIKTIEVESKCKKEHLSWWDKLWIKLGRFWTLVFVGFVGFKAFKYYRKFHLPI